MRVLNLHKVPKGFQYVLAALLISVGFTSCEKDSYMLQSDQKPLSFVTLSKNIKASSRAAYSGEFGTTIYHLDQLEDIDKNNKNTKIYDNIVNTKVLNKNGIWTTETDKYWPGTGGLLVTAYSPFNKNIGTNGVQMPYNMNSPYVYGSTLNNQTDLLFADVQWLPVKTSSDAAIPVKFNHALAMISVNIGLATLGVGEYSWKLTLTQIALVNINNQGMVTINNNGNNGWNTNNQGAWNVTKGEYETFNYSTPVQLSTSPVTVFDKKIVIPQLLRSDTEANFQAIQITYNLETTRKFINNDGVEETKIEVKNNLSNTIPLKTDHIDIWKMGQHITYNITFNSGVAIEFEGSAQPWKDDFTINDGNNDL